MGRDEFTFDTMRELLSEQREEQKRLRTELDDQYARVERQYVELSKCRIDSMDMRTRIHQLEEESRTKDTRISLLQHEVDMQRLKIGRLEGNE